MKYCVWLPKYPKRSKIFLNSKKGLKYLNKQKQEAYLNIKVGTLNEDTFKGVNVGWEENFLWKKQN